MNFLGKTINNLISYTSSQTVVEELVIAAEEDSSKEENISSSESSDSDFEEQVISTKNEDEDLNMSVGAVTNAESKISELTEYSFHPNSVDPLEFTRHAKGVYRKKINRKTITEEERAQILWEEAVITYFNGDEVRAKKYQKDYLEVEETIKSFTGSMYSFLIKNYSFVSFDCGVLYLNYI